MDNVVRIFVFAGQSNMSGKTAVDAFPDAEEVQSHIYYSHEFSQSRFGPEYGFVRTLEANGAEDYVILKSALPGSSITPNRPFDIPDWHPDSVGELYDTLLAGYADLVAEIIANGDTPVLEGFYWDQGGADRKYTAEYADNLNYFFESLHEDLGAFDTFFRSGNHATREDVIDDLKVVTEIQAQFILGNDDVFHVSNQGFTHIDGLHFDASSQYISGKGMADAYLGIPDFVLPGDVFIQEKFFGTAADDIIFGTPGDDILKGRLGNDTIFGDAGNDILFGGLGDDYLFDSIGNDIVLPGAGDDTIMLGDGRDRVIYNIPSASNGHDDLFGYDPTEDVLVFHVPVEVKAVNGKLEIFHEDHNFLTIHDADTLL